MAYAWVNYMAIEVWKVSEFFLLMRTQTEAANSKDRKREIQEEQVEVILARLQDIVFIIVYTL